MLSRPLAQRRPRGQAEGSGPVGGGSHGRMLWPSPLGSPWQQDHHRGSATVPPPGPASAGQEEGGPRLAGGSGQGPWGRPGCCLQARHRAPASPHPALGPNTEPTGRSQTDKQGTAHGEGRGGVRQPEARKQDRLLCPQPRGRDRLNSPRDGHVSRGSCGRTRGRRGRESGDACRAQLRQAQACPCRRNSMD